MNLGRKSVVWCLAAATALCMGVSALAAGVITTPRQPPSQSMFAHVVLQDGKVLIAGGQNLVGSESSYGGTNAVGASSRLFEPRTGSWQEVGSLNIARRGGKAVVLADGKVLLVGGTGANTPTDGLASSEIYDPASQSWSFGPPLPASYTLYTLTALNDGRALATGYQGALLFDPTSRTWSTAASPQVRHSSAPAVLLKNGKVLSISGYGTTATVVVEAYDPVANRWDVLAPLDFPRTFHTAVVLSDGRVLVIGGTAWPRGDWTTLTTIYDPATNRWTPAASVPIATAQAFAAPMSDGRALLVHFNGTIDRAISVYYSKTDRWSAVESFAEMAPVPQSLADGRVLVMADRNPFFNIGTAFMYEAPTASECMFDWLEATYPQYAAPSVRPTVVNGDWRYRSYATTVSHVGVNNGVLYYLGPAFGNQLLSLGAAVDWQRRAGCIS